MSLDGARQGQHSRGFVELAVNGQGIVFQGGKSGSASRGHQCAAGLDELGDGRRFWLVSVRNMPLRSLMILRDFATRKTWSRLADRNSGSSTR